MLANSPDSPEGRAQLASLPESAAEDSIDQDEPAPEPAPIRSLAEELGVSEDDDSPSREKPGAKAGALGIKRKAGAQEPSERRTQPLRTAAAISRDKGKGRADPAPGPTSRARAGSSLEKDNVKRAKLSNGTNGAKTAAGPAKPAKAAPPPGRPPSSGAQSSRTRTTTGPGSGGKAPSRPKGGARRVPVGSAEAAPGATWRG